MSDIGLRDHFAAAALPVIVAEPTGLDWGKNNVAWPSAVAKKAYRIADAMMAERQKPNITGEK